MIIRSKSNWFLYKKFGIQQIVISPVDLVLHKVLGGYEGVCIFGIEFDNTTYWVTIDDGEKSYEYSCPEVFRVEHKLIGEILFEKIIRV